MSPEDLVATRQLRAALIELVAEQLSRASADRVRAEMVVFIKMSDASIVY